jgi:hypothetical protein
MKGGPALELGATIMGLHTGIHPGNAAPTGESLLFQVSKMKAMSFQQKSSP